MVITEQLPKNRGPLLLEHITSGGCHGVPFSIHADTATSAPFHLIYMQGLKALSMKEAAQEGCPLSLEAFSTNAWGTHLLCV